MKKKMMKTISSFIVLSLLILGVSIFLIFKENWIGPAYIGMSALSIIVLKLFGIKIKRVLPDIIFGIIDNGILVFAAILGGTYAGVVGAVLGGAAGNTITDGIGGIFEGKIAEKLRQNNIKEKRTALSTMLGKMIGCLFGAGIALSIVSIIKFIFVI